MTNLDHLRKLTADLPNAEEITEFIDAVETELGDAEDEAERLQRELDELELYKELDDEEKEEISEEHTTEHFHTCNLGLDTIKYRLTHGNIKVTMQLEKWMEDMRRVNLVSTAPVLLDIN